ncbi:MAG: DUF4404 family protein [Verrucomicrobia bacterium]|nr:DUF4404 family protein [Verrucomicrobiota bacterium]MDE3100021.1 DUF4404 family protein [Verrucomicrobiota bacterium]
MIEQTIAELEARISGESGLEAARRAELLRLIGALKSEMAALEGGAQKRNLKSLKSSVDELRSSVEGFEQSHPRLVQTVNNISNTLSNLGI